MNIEIAKNGINPNEVIELYRHIVDNCKNLQLEGLMTIGRFGHDYSTGPNPDFECLLQCHTNVCNTFNLNPAVVHMSMGMSDDFEQAVSHPSIHQKYILHASHHSYTHAIAYENSQQLPQISLIFFFS